ncbi:DUF4397 domain-containing protein [Bacillus mesophilum]|uniref:DUF4397 domain-containing protein n=1 Tax=Bacillus mesophilum TaxID=1071718 RepID=A0A7V7RMM8_9BACI|nr:DUF4397 domain-containing protein [Bacillus mesophilum]KAB2333569.1 DUF4397 domain-containing protein [Bacillus mesophilum]
MENHSSAQPHFMKAEHYRIKADYYKYTDIEKYTKNYQKYLQHIYGAMKHSRTNSLQPLQVLPSRIRLLHAAHDVEKADIYLNGSKILQNFRYSDGSSYLALPSGTYQLDLYPAGNSDQRLLHQVIEIEQGKAYTISISGIGEAIKGTIFEDDQIVPHGEASFRFIHLSTDAPAIDLAVKNGDVVFHSISYRQASEYLGISPITVHLHARVAGSDNHIFPIENIVFKANTINTIFLVGSITGRPQLDVLMM